MKTKYAVSLAGLAALSLSNAFAQDSDHSWSKTYPISGKPSLTIETADSSLAFHACSECREVRIRVETEGHKLSDYRLTEGQSGDQIHFSLKRPENFMGVHHWGPEHTSVTIDTPAQVTLQARTADGGVTVSGLEGDLGLKTADGNVDLDHVAGNLHIESGDGRVTVNDAKGAIQAHTSDGDLKIDGLFQSVALHTSDGSLNVSLRDGTRLTGSSTIESSDGSVTLRVPSNFAANLNVHTSDGHVHCALPITTDHYDSSGEGNRLAGKLNGGGSPLTIHTSDGSVRIEQL